MFKNNKKIKEVKLLKETERICTLTTKWETGLRNQDDESKIFIEDVKNTLLEYAKKANNNANNICEDNNFNSIIDGLKDKFTDANTEKEVKTILIEYYNNANYKGQNFSKEKVYIKYLLNKLKIELQDDKIENRIQNILLWTFKRAIAGKCWYYLLTIISILAASLIPVVTLMDLKSVTLIVTSLSVINVFMVSICNMFMFRENWHRYRRFTENIKSECVKYICGYGEDYKDKNTKAEEVKKIFLTIIENMSMLENNDWLNDRKNKP